jgi:hypothetical protein
LEGYHRGGVEADKKFVYRSFVRCELGEGKAFLLQIPGDDGGVGICGEECVCSRGGREESLVVPGNEGERKKRGCVSIGDSVRAGTVFFLVKSEVCWILHLEGVVEFIC